MNLKQIYDNIDQYFKGDYMKNKIELNIDFLTEVIKLKDSDYPSKNTYRYWILYRLKSFSNFKSSDITGKWCIFLTGEEVDEKWVLIKSLIDRKEIISAKVSTSLSQVKNNEYVICVYTKDWSDVEDLKKTRASLSSVGFTKKIKYKRDIDTFNNVKGEKEFFLSM